MRLVHLPLAVLFAAVAVARRAVRRPGAGAEPSRPSPEATPARRRPPPPPPSKVFNPDIAVIGNFLGAIGENDVDPPPSLEMEEAELSLQAVVDPYARADFFLAFGPDEAGVEEAFITFPTLPGGFLMKVGKLKASFGKANTFHAHNLPWTDRPLVNVEPARGRGRPRRLRALALAPDPHPGLFLELTGEVFRGDSGGLPRRGARRRRLRRPPARRTATSARPPTSTSADRSPTATSAVHGETARLYGVDAALRWRPLQRALYRRFLPAPSWSGAAARCRRKGCRRHVRDGASRADDGDRTRRPTSPPSTSSRGGGSPAPAATGRSASTTRRRGPGRLAPAHLLAERVQPGPRPVPPHPVRRGPDRNELLFQLLFSIGAHGAHPF